MPVRVFDGERVSVTAAAGDVMGFSSEGLWDDDCVRFCVALCLIFFGRGIEVVMFRSIGLLIYVFNLRDLDGVVGFVGRCMLYHCVDACGESVMA